MEFWGQVSGADSVETMRLHGIHWTVDFYYSCTHPYSTPKTAAMLPLCYTEKVFVARICDSLPTCIHCRRLGGSESEWTHQPNQEGVSSYPCVRARIVIHVRSEMRLGLCQLLFSLWSRVHFPFPFRIFHSELVSANLNESR